MPSHDPEKRVDDILHSIELINAYVQRAGGVDAVLAGENVHLDAIERRLLIISEAAIKLGEMAPKLEPNLDWRGIRGIGNPLRHHYDRISPTIIRDILTDDLSSLANACRRMKANLAKKT